MALASAAQIVVDYAILNAPNSPEKITPSQNHLKQRSYENGKIKKGDCQKSQAIRDALEAHPGKSTAEIAEQLKAKGLDINAQYVSTIKSNAKAKGLKRRVVKRRNTGSVVAGHICPSAFARMPICSRLPRTAFELSQPRFARIEARGQEPDTRPENFPVSRGFPI
jgi:hypothetical protein